MKGRNPKSRVGEGGVRKDRQGWITNDLHTISPN